MERKSSCTCSNCFLKLLSASCVFFASPKVEAIDAFQITSGFMSCFLFVSCKKAAYFCSNVLPRRIRNRSSALPKSMSLEMSCTLAPAPDASKSAAFRHSSCLQGKGLQSTLQCILSRKGMLLTMDNKKFSLPRRLGCTCSPESRSQPSQWHPARFRQSQLPQKSHPDLRLVEQNPIHDFPP